MPAYNAERTLKKTCDEIPHSIVDEIILVDDGSIDKTTIISRGLGIKTFVHEKISVMAQTRKHVTKEFLRLEQI